VGEEKSTAASCGWGKNVVRESLADIVGSAIDALIDSSVLAQRQALVKNTCEEAPSLVGNMVHTWIVMNVREQHD
jgi:hypothetical protein